MVCDPGAITAGALKLENWRNMQKFYCFVDESGQDTKGGIFIVTVVVLEEDREQVIRFCEDLEIQTRKGTQKWRRSTHQSRRDENDPLTRLADALAGFLRDALGEESSEIVELFQAAKRRGILVEV